MSGEVKYTDFIMLIRFEKACTNGKSGRNAATGKNISAAVCSKGTTVHNDRTAIMDVYNLITICIRRFIVCVFHTSAG